MGELLKDGGLMQRVGGTDKHVRITPTLDTNAYAQNDILFATTELPNALLSAAGSALWVSLRVWEKTNSARAMRIMILRSNTSVGTANAAENISDASGLEIVAGVDIAAGDWTSFANFCVATKRAADLGTYVYASSGTSLYAAAKYTDATEDTFAADDLVLEFGFAPGVS
jgi:hypothetical protein